MPPREKWTDERLDDLNRRVESGFARVESDIRELRLEVKRQGESLRTEMRAGFEKAEKSSDRKIEVTKVDLEKKIEDTRVHLEKMIEDTKVGLEKKIDDGIGRLERDNNSLKRIIYAAAATVILSQIADLSLL